MSKVPAVVENHLDAIHCFKDGKVILASSNLTGRYWNGSLWCFKNSDDAPDVEKCVTGIDASSGISDIVCFEDNTVALGLDSGGVEVYKLDTESDSPNFTWVFGTCEHDDYVSSLSLSCDQKTLVSAGADKCIKIWDAQTWATTATFRPVHSGIIWQVSCSPTDSNIFITSGQDGKVLMFDLRLAKPASVLNISPLKGDITALAWKPGSDCTFATGDESGSVVIRTTKGSKNICDWSDHTRRIHRISFSPCTPSWLASIADDNELYIRNVDGENPVLIYKSDQHTDFVRGITWSQENAVISCGWDKKVVKHVCV